MRKEPVSIETIEIFLDYIHFTDYLPVEHSGRFQSIWQNEQGLKANSLSLIFYRLIYAALLSCCPAIFLCWRADEWVAIEKGERSAVFEKR